MPKRTLTSVVAGVVVTSVVAITTVLLAPLAAAAADTQPPTAPGVPVAVSVTTTQITLAWGVSTDDVGVTGYDLYRATGSPSGEFVRVGSATSNTFTDTGLTPSTVYQYRVQARDAAGNVSAFSPIGPAMTAGPCTTPPPAPGNLTIVAFSPSAVSLRWGIVVPNFGCNPAGINVERATGTGAFTTIAQIAFTTNYVDTSVAPNTTYRYQVRTRSANGLISGPSNLVQLTTPNACTPPLPLGGLTVTSVTTTSVSLSWAGPTNPACFAYDVLRATGTSTSFTLVGSTTNLSFTNVGLTQSTVYRYIVQGRIIPSGSIWGTTNPVTATTHQGCLLIPPPAPGNLTASNVSLVVGHADLGRHRRAGLFLHVRGSPRARRERRNLRAGRHLERQLVHRHRLDGQHDIPLPGPHPRRRRQPVAGIQHRDRHHRHRRRMSASYRIVNAWGDAFQAEVGVTNTSIGSINGWRVTLTLAGGASITQIWGGLTAQTASPYTVANDTYNGAFGANGSTTFGFIASVSGTTGANGTVSCTVRLGAGEYIVPAGLVWLGSVGASGAGVPSIGLTPALPIAKVPPVDRPGRAFWRSPATIHLVGHARGLPRGASPDTWARLRHCWSRDRPLPKEGRSRRIQV